MRTSGCEPGGDGGNGDGERPLTRPCQRDLLFFVMYAGLLIYGFFWADFPHVEEHVTNPALLRAVLGAGLVYVAMRSFVVFTRHRQARWETFWVAIDLVLITALVRLSGGMHSEAALMYVIPIFTYSIQRRVWGTMAVGIFAGILYTLATLPAAEGPAYFGQLLTRLVVLVLVTVMATCYAVHETTRVNELAGLRARVALADYRRELSSEMHDGIQHYLVSMAMRLQMAKTVAEDDPKRAVTMVLDQRLLLRQAADELRYLIRRLRAPALEHRGFVDALREHIEMFRQRSTIEVTLEVEGEPTILPADLEHAAFRIVQEGLTNVEKHAEASEVHVHLTFGDGCLECEIKDNGVGFDMSGLPEEPDIEGGFGLATMQQRAEQAGGRIEIESVPGTGTSIHFEARVAVSGSPRVEGGRAAGQLESDAPVEAMAQTGGHE